MRKLSIVSSLALGFGLVACTGEETTPETTAPETTAPETTPEAPKADPVKVDGNRVVVLGFDGVDPDYIEQWKAELPHLAEFIDQGRFHRLGTTTPPQSPVAWSTFATSTNPGKHAVFDFVGRDPAKYFPKVATNAYSGPEFDSAGKVTGPGTSTSPRQGESFWKTAADAGVPTKVLSVPYSFPADDLGANGSVLSGLGVPDLRLTNSTFYLFGSDIDAASAKESVAGGKKVSLSASDAGFSGVVEGPYGLTKKREKVSLTFTPDTAGKSVTISGAGVEVTVAEGSFSDYATLEFPVSNFYSAKGLVRFYPLEVSDERVSVYMYPLMFDPEDPYIPFTHPADFGQSLADEYGDYKTIGWVHDTSALNSNLVPEEVFVSDMEQIFQKRLEMTLGELEKSDAKLFISVFTAPDRASHMLTRLTDPTHPTYDAALAAEFGDTIKNTYLWMDDAIGKIKDQLGETDTLILLSDHGFHSFKRGFNTNTWLAENGYLALQKPASATTKIIMPGTVDWAATKAYALGTGQIYINLEGREGKGSVSAADYESVAREIAAGLEAAIDPETGRKVLDKVHFRGDAWSGDLDAVGAPDLQVGFAEGYQTSRATSLGGVPEGLVSDNDKKWSGDHASSNAADTEGFLVVDAAGVSGEVHIRDLAPTILKLVGVDAPAHYEGKALIE